MTAPETQGPTVTAADEELALKLWRVHPSDIIAEGMTRPQWYARELASHREAAEAASRAREAELREALEGVRAWAASLTVCDMNEIVADNGITAGMVVGQEAVEQVRRIDRALLARRSQSEKGEG